VKHNTCASGRLLRRGLDARQRDIPLDDQFNGQYGLFFLASFYTLQHTFLKSRTVSVRNTRPSLGYYAGVSQLMTFVPPGLHVAFPFSSDGLN